MTRTEVEQLALRLSTKERASLVRALLASLESESRLTAELEDLGTRLEATMTRWFDASLPRIELGNDDWERILRGEYRHAPIDDSSAVPPGWRSPRLRGERS
ncbi:MAG: hypothetical protein AAGD38_13150 [Acidobacteriota bacterium]